MSRFFLPKIPRFLPLFFFILLFLIYGLLFFSNKQPVWAVAYCGDGTCDPGEDCANCEVDCGACPSGDCSDGVCQEYLGEDCESCPTDCGPCAWPGYIRCDQNTCPDGQFYWTFCTPNCTAIPRTCYDDPACGIPPDCTDPSTCDIPGYVPSPGGCCPSDAHCGPGAPVGCGQVICASGGNCYSDCSDCWENGDPTPPPPPIPSPTPSPGEKSCFVYIDSDKFPKDFEPEVTLIGQSPSAAGDEVRLFLEDFPGGNIISPIPEYVWPGTPGWFSPADEQFYDPYYYYQIEGASCTSSNDDSCSNTTWLDMGKSGYYCLHCDIEAGSDKCSGNPQCTYEGGALNCSGWVSCSDNDNVCFTVYAPPDCTEMTIASSVVEGDLVPIEVTADDEDGSVANVTFRYTSYQGEAWEHDYCSETWDFIDLDLDSAGGWTGEWDTSGLIGEYWVIANVVDDENYWCSGNPDYCSASGADAQCTDCREKVEVVSLTCTLELLPTSMTIILDESLGLPVADIDVQNGGSSDIVDITFSSLDPAIVSVTSSDPLDYSATTTGEALGSTTIVATATLRNGYQCDCWETSTCTTVTVDPPEAWFQAKEGDIHAEDDIYNDLPVGENFCLDGEGGTPGVVSYGGVVPDLGSGSISSVGWLANTNFNTENFAFFYELMDEPASNISGDISLNNLSSDVVFYASAGIDIINGDLPAGKKAIILVQGNVDIQRNIIVQVGSFLAIIASGNIEITGTPTGEPKDVSDIQGIFIADGAFETGASDAEDTELTAEGMFIANSFQLGRKLQADGLDMPGELFDYRPDFFFNAPPEILIPHYTWDELLPD